MQKRPPAVYLREDALLRMTAALQKAGFVYGWFLLCFSSFTILATSAVRENGVMI